MTHSFVQKMWKLPVSLLSVIPQAHHISDNSAPNSPDLSSVPKDYHNPKQVFSKKNALSLPPHHPHDCALRLLPGAPLPTSQLYSLCWPERESIEMYMM